jgi:hypothetical protein
MFTLKKHVKSAKSITYSADATVPIYTQLDYAKTGILVSSLSTPHKFSLKISIVTLVMMLLTFSTLPAAFADNGTANSVRWYRYYNSQGIPTLSSTISEQHLQYGYDSLDKNLRLIRHFPPFSGQRYAQEEAQREQAIDRRIAERHLQETYISSDRAIIQRDRELGDLDGQISRSQKQSVELSATLNETVTQAANLERQNKPIPLFLKNQLNTNKDLLIQSLANVAALKVKRDQTSKQFNDAIASLKSIEQRGTRTNSNNKP